MRLLAQVARYSGPLRESARWAKRRVVQGGVILMYHRLADEQSDPWDLCVSPVHFGEHLAVLRAARVRLTTAAGLAAAVAARSIPRRTVAITFDDGYLDNLDTGRPLLERYEAPATLFVSSGYVGHRGEFWWDTLERVFLEDRALPDRLELSVAGRRHRWDLSGDRARGEAAGIRLMRRADPAGLTARQLAFVELRQLLLGAAAEERMRIPAELLAWAGLTQTARPARRIMAADDLRRFAADDLVEIGAHSISHPELTRLGPTEQEEELRGGKLALEALLDRPVTGLAYPHGAHDAQTVRLAGAAGFAYGCTIEPEAVRCGTALHRLPRVGVADMSGSEFKALLGRFIPL